MSRRTSRSRETTTSNNTATSTPNTPGYIQQPVTDYFGQVGSLISGFNDYTPTTYGPTANQQAAFTGVAGLNTPNSGISQSMDATRGLLNFQPDNINGWAAPGSNQSLNQATTATQGLMGYSPMSVSGWQAPANNQSLNQAASATQGLLNFTPNAVQAGQLSSTDLSPYMNPYQRDVIDAANADFQNLNASGLNQLNTAGSGAWGGSRSAVAQGQLIGDNTRNFANQLAALRSAGFQQAQQAALADIGNRMGADQFNTSTGLQGANLRLGAANQLGQLGLAGSEDARANASLSHGIDMDRANLDMQGANMRLGAANQLGQLGLAGDENTRANVGLSHGIDMDRANLGLQGAGVRLNAANQLYNQGAGADANSRANIAAQLGTGEAERQIGMENDPTQQRIRYLQQLQALLGVSPESLFGETLNQTGSGTRTGSTTQTGFGFGWSPQNGFSIGG